MAVTICIPMKNRLGGGGGALSQVFCYCSWKLLHSDILQEIFVSSVFSWVAKWNNFPYNNFGLFPISKKISRLGKKGNV